VYRKACERVRHGQTPLQRLILRFCERALLIATLSAAANRAAIAGDWPQILGPNRNGIAERETLAERWTEGGPKTIWKRDVGRGFSGVAVAEGTLVLFHRVGDEEVVEALDPKTGERRWKAGFAVRYESSISSDDGPRATPVIHDGHVYLFGVTSGLYCLRLKDGSTSRPRISVPAARRSSRGTDCWSM
jgi:outer membrane protein assembly factor BamB